MKKLVSTLLSKVNKSFVIASLFLLTSMTAFSQSYPKLVSSSGDCMFQKTSSTTATLKFENSYGNVVTRYLSNRKVTQETMIFNFTCFTYTTSNGEKVVLKKMDLDPNYTIYFYNELGRELWSDILYVE